MGTFTGTLQNKHREVHKSPSPFFITYTYVTHHDKFHGRNPFPTIYIIIFIKFQ